MAEASGPSPPAATVTGQAYPDRPNTYVNSARLQLTATDSGCAGVKDIEYREQGTTAWLPYSAEVTFQDEKIYNIEFRATDRKDKFYAFGIGAVDYQRIHFSDVASVGNPLLPNLMAAPLGGLLALGGGAAAWGIRERRRPVVEQAPRAHRARPACRQVEGPRLRRGDGARLQERRAAHPLRGLHLRP